MGLFDKLRAFLFGERKALQMVPTWQVGQVQGLPMNYTSLSKGGYKKNEIAYACIRRLSSSIAEPKLRVLTGYDETTGKEIEAPQEHALVELLTKPNPEMTYFDMLEATMIMLAIGGNAYWEKERVGVEQTQALWPMRPDRVRVIPSAYGPRAYEYTVGDYKKLIRAEDVIHFTWYDPINDFFGMSPLQVASRSADADNERTDFVRAFFANAGVPYGLLTTKVKMERAEALRIKREWKEQYGGLQGWSNIAVLDADAAYVPLGLKMTDMAFPELTQLTEARICMCFGVPPILIGASVGLEQSTYSNYEQARKAFWEDTMAPHVRKIEETLNLAFQEEFGAEIDLDLSEVKALQEDRSAKWERATLAIKDGWVTVNEARLEAGLDTIDGQDVFIRPFGTVIINAESGEVEQTFQPTSPFADEGGAGDQGTPNQDNQRPRASNDGDNRRERRAADQIVALVKYHLAEMHKAARRKDVNLMDDMRRKAMAALTYTGLTYGGLSAMDILITRALKEDWPWSRLEKEMRDVLEANDGPKKGCTCPECTKGHQQAAGPLGRIFDTHKARGARAVADYLRSEQKLVKQIIAEEYHGSKGLVTNWPRLNDKLSRVSRAGALVLASSLQPVIEGVVQDGARFTWARVAKYRLEEKLKEYKGMKAQGDPGPLPQPNLKPDRPQDLTEKPKGVKPVGVYYVTPEDMANNVVAVPINTQKMVNETIEKAAREGWSEQDLQLRIDEMYRGWCEWRSETDIIGFGSNAVNRASRDAGQNLEHSEIRWIANNSACEDCQGISWQDYTVPEKFTTQRFNILLKAMRGDVHTRKPTPEEAAEDEATVDRIWRVWTDEPGGMVITRSESELEEWEQAEREAAEREAELDYRSYKKLDHESEWTRAFKLIDKLEPSQSVAPTFVIRVDMPRKWSTLGLRQLVPIGAEQKVEMQRALMRTKAGEAAGKMHGPRAAIVFDVPGEDAPEYVTGEEMTDYALLGESCHWTPPLHANCRCELEVRVGPYEGEAWPIHPEDSITFIEDEEAWMQNYIQEKQQREEQRLRESLEEQIKRETEEWFAEHASPEEMSRRAAEAAAEDWEAYKETLPKEGWSIPWLGAPPYTDEQLDEALRDEKEQIAREARQRIKDEIEADARAWEEQRDYPSLAELGRQAQENAAQAWEEEKKRLEREQYLLLVEQSRHMDEELERLTRRPWVMPQSL